jgi:hypothetical protein
MPALTTTSSFQTSLSIKEVFYLKTTHQNLPNLSAKGGNVNKASKLKTDAG